METKLIEFENHNRALLRGILTVPEDFSFDSIVIMYGGFERSATTEKKFKALADKLAEDNLAAFRFDAADCGLSDGNFYQTTVESLADDLRGAIEKLKLLGYKKLSIVGHSLAGCVISLLVDKIDFEKIVLLAPALNQKELLRLWFAQKKNSDKKIGWDNYKNNFQEADFLESLKVDLVTKSHKLNFEYRLKNADIDYSQNYNNIGNIPVLLVHGKNDDVVPPESLNIVFNNQIIVDGGDHNLEQPGIIEQWLERVSDFLVNRSS